MGGWTGGERGSISRRPGVLGIRRGGGRGNILRWSGVLGVRKGAGNGGIRQLVRLFGLIR